MAYWWVNQNQTFDQEIEGGYLWSPQRNTNGHRNPFYEFMKEVQPGDVVLSFSDTWIRAVGIAKSYAYPSAKPSEFGNIGVNWHPTEGWRVDVRWRLLDNPVRPRDHIGRLRLALPNRYSPLQESGAGLQGVYLTSVPDALYSAIAGLVGSELTVLMGGTRDTNVSASEITKEQEAAERILEDVETLRIDADRTLRSTEKDALVKARIGQGVFKRNVATIERYCRITKVDRIEHLIASHTKPWYKSSNDERLNGNNGFLLTPTADHLFGGGFITFENDGTLVLSPVAHVESLKKMGVRSDEKVNVGSFTDGQREFLDFHRENVFKLARVTRAG